MSKEKLVHKNSPKHSSKTLTLFFILSTLVASTIGCGGGNQKIKVNPREKVTNLATKPLDANEGHSSLLTHNEIVSQLISIQEGSQKIVYLKSEKGIIEVTLENKRGSANVGGLTKGTNKMRLNLYGIKNVEDFLNVVRKEGAKNNISFSYFYEIAIAVLKQEELHFTLEQRYGRYIEGAPEEIKKQVSEGFHELSAESASFKEIGPSYTIIILVDLLTRKSIQDEGTEKAGYYFKNEFYMNEIYKIDNNASKFITDNQQDYTNSQGVNMTLNIFVSKFPDVVKNLHIKYNESVNPDDPNTGIRIIKGIQQSFGNQRK